MEWLLKRLTEASTWLGLGGAIAVAGEAWKVDQAPAAAHAISTTGQAIAHGVPWYQWVPLLVGSLMGVFLRDKGPPSPGTGR